MAAPLKAVPSPGRPRKAAPAAAPARKRVAAKPKTVEEAAKSGKKREFLVAMRDRIARTVDKPDCPPRELAALTKRLQDLCNDIEALDAANPRTKRTRAVHHDDDEDQDDGDDDAFDPEAI